MSEFKVEAFRIGQMEPHPNADTLSITHYYDYPVIVKTTDFNVGDMATYIPIDAQVPADRPEFAFLNGSGRIKAKRLRGILSMGLAIKAPDFAQEGDNLQEFFGITKWEPKEELSMGGEAISTKVAPWFLEYDLEGYRKFPDLLSEGEEVVITEKIDGTNTRFCFFRGELWCGSHHMVRRNVKGDLWWGMAEKLHLAERLSEYPGYIFFAETFGVGIRPLTYGRKNPDILFYDIYSVTGGHYLNYDVLDYILHDLGLPQAPVLYSGPWCSVLAALCEGETTLGGDHIREGIVIRPTHERYDDKAGRVVLKLKSEAYLLSKYA